MSAYVHKVTRGLLCQVSIGSVRDMTPDKQQAFTHTNLAQMSHLASMS